MVTNSPNVISLNTMRKSPRLKYEYHSDDHPEMQGRTRICALCKEEKPMQDFGRCSYARLGRNYRCKVCTKKNQQKRSPKYRNSRKNYQLKYRYGISLEAMTALLQSQSGKCAICQDHISIDDRSAVLDHHHGTKAVRGVLCVKCNIGLGVFREKKDFFLSAIKYLEDRR